MPVERRSLLSMKEFKELHPHQALYLAGAFALRGKCYLSEKNGGPESSRWLPRIEIDAFEPSGLLDVYFGEPAPAGHFASPLARYTITSRPRIVAFAEVIEPLLPPGSVSQRRLHHLAAWARALLAEDSKGAEQAHRDFMAVTPWRPPAGARKRKAT